MKLIKRHLFGGLLNSIQQFLKPSYSSNFDERPTGPTPPVKGWSKLSLMEIDKPVDTKTYNGGTLPGVTVTAPNLNKPQPFPYGQINVEKENGRILAYPTGNSPLQEAVFRNKAKRQIAGNRGLLFLNGGSFNGLPLSFILQFQLNQTNPLTGKKPEVKGWEINDGKFNVLTAQGGDKLPKLNEWKFRRTTNNLNNGYSVISDLIMLTVENGYKTYDNPPISSGRTIYVTPNGNDTIFYRNKDIFDHNPQGDKNLKAAKSYFYKMIKLAPTEHSEYKGTKYWSNNDAQIDAARNRAIKGFQGGGEVRADNTRVASGRPQQVLNKIPYGAGKGPAGEGPMRLFNDPYINMGLMAMAPVAIRQHRNGVSYAPPTIKDIINNIKKTGLHGLPVNPEVGISLNTLMKYTGKSPEQINSIMLPKYGDIRIETLPNSKRQLGIWRIKGDKDLVLNEVLELLK